MIHSSSDLPIGNYTEAGVNLEMAAVMKKRIAEMAKKTRTEVVVTGPGGFGGVVSPWRGAPSYMVATTDGVGTKVRIAQMMGEHKGIGIDIVNHCVNDILCMGAQPLFFLDYIGMSTLDETKIEALITGICDGCADAGCALLGGETATMPGVYAPGDYDLVGFMVGIVNPDSMLKIENVKVGDIAIAVPSNGLHTNGYSLIRKAFNLDNDPSPLESLLPDDGRTFGEALLAPHTSYLECMRPYLKMSTKPLAHITGGGIYENVARILPSNLSLEVDCLSWTPSALFRYIHEKGGIEYEEMFRVFNMGVGMIGFLPRTDEETVKKIESAWTIGRVTERKQGQAVRFINRERMPL